jgi:2-dehydro-3-deoxyphosphogluconate aldolase/(4S)-4-hydroxy-2-oxoglutarate aldolase
MKREQAKACIEGIGIFPGIRVASAGEALHSAETLHEAGIAIAEITMRVPGALDVIRQLAKRFPNLVVGAGTVLDKDTAERCLDAKTTIYHEHWVGAGSDVELSVWFVRICLLSP